MSKASVLSYLKKEINKELQKDDISNKRRNFLNLLLSTEENDITFGEFPKYFFAYLKCNSTGVGTSTFENSKTQRTVAMDYTTDELLFIDGHEGTAVKGLELFYLKEGEVINYHKKSDMKKVANSYGVKLHMQQFRDLNFTLKDHRVNRYNANITKEPFSYPIRPIYASVIDVEQPVLIGYMYEMEGEDYIIIDLKESKARGKGTSVFSPWMLIGVIFPPVLIIAIIVILFRLVKD